MILVLRTIESVIEGYSRHYARWQSHDVMNPKQPINHQVIGPLFKTEDAEAKKRALKEFSALVEQKVLDFPPCKSKT